jgi:hypothetical protein
MSGHFLAFILFMTDARAGSAISTSGPVASGTTVRLARCRGTLVVTEFYPADGHRDCGGRVAIDTRRKGGRS